MSWKDALLAKTLARLSNIQRYQVIQTVLEHSRTISDPSDTLTTAIQQLETAQTAKASATHTITALRNVLSAMPSDQRKTLLHHIDAGMIQTIKSRK